jgi:TPR repeat protein
MPTLHDDFMAKLLAANEGDAAALAWFGVNLFRTPTHADRHAVSSTLLHAAAEQGDAEAQNSLGVFYSFGIGVDRDEREAVKWFLKAAEQGHSDAQHRLGQAYLTIFRVTPGVTPNDAEELCGFATPLRKVTPKLNTI